MAVRTRFAPSPTGRMHLGNAWVAFLNWLWTRQHGGTVILRIEDIDEARCRPAYTEALMEDLSWLGLSWDEGPEKDEAYGPAVQSRRSAFYEEILRRWKEAGEVYPCFCSRARIRQIASAPHPGEAAPQYDGHCRYLSKEEAAEAEKSKKPSWRIRMEDCEISFTDLFRGKETGRLRAGSGDFVLFRADGMIAYQLAASADDGAMGVTHVFRGDDLLESTFGQIYILKKLGYAVPVYAHLPLLIDREGVRLSKRQHGITIEDLRRAGLSPGRILGQLLFWAGAIPAPQEVTAAEALGNISFDDCRSLSKRAIAVDPEELLL